MTQVVLEPLFRYDLPADQDPIRRLIDRRIPWAIHGDLYSQQSFGTGPWADQGWKVHVSATPLSAADVLEAALDVLFAEGARFKVARSITILSALNAGQLGLSQIGKFITVYPSDDAQAVRVALALHESTRGHRGPRIPSDRPLRPDSLVHYRYGTMRQRPESEAAGEGAFGAYDLLDPAGRLTNDMRLHFYVPPREIADPFVAAGAYIARPARSTLLNGRYLAKDALSRGPRGGVFRAIDLGAQPIRLCLLKEAWHDVSLDAYGRDARDWAANEERILARHADDPVLPRFLDSFELDDNRYIAIEYIDGTPLDRVASEKHSAKDGAPPSDVVAIGLATAESLAHLHDIGIVFRDFKPANVIETSSGGYRLIDFGIAYEYLVDDGPALGLGTPPFCSREQFDGERPSPADDVFAWGAVLHYFACGEVSLTDGSSEDVLPKAFPRKPVSELRPAFPATIAAVIDRAVAWEPAERYATMLEARDALAGAARALPATPAGGTTMIASSIERKESVSPPSLLGSADALDRARAVGDALCAAAEERGGGLCWAARNEMSERPQYGPDLYCGAAGIGLFLAELAHATHEARYADAARGAARWLAGPTWGRGHAQHGLHGGEPGIAYFFVRLARLLDEPEYITAAELRVRRLAGSPAATADLIHGSAGTVLSLLHLHAATGESSYLADARVAGDQMLRSALPAPNGGIGRYWEVASPAPGGGTSPYLGLLHGAAGIGLALLQLAIATGDDEYLGAATSAAELLLSQARPSHADSSKLASSEADAVAWPRQIGDTAAGLQAHCHGAGGIGQFFVRLHREVPDARFRAAAEGAALTVAAQREIEPRACVCHGLSGTAHVLLDCHQSFGDPRWLALARECGAHLQRFRVVDRSGIYTMNGEGAISPDLMLGYAGVGSALLRLARPESTSELILG